MTMPLEAASCEMFQKLRYTVSIYDEDTVLTDHSKDGARFLVNREQLMRFFQTEITFRPEPGLLWMRSDGTSQRSLLRFAPRKNQAILLRRNKKTEVIRMDIPATVFLVSVVDDQINSLWVWCHAGTFSEKSILYEMPLPNISGSDICLGGSSKKVVGSLRESVERLFFDTPFNSHHFNVGREDLPFTEFVQKYQGKTPFSRLKKIGVGRDLLI